jgi:hypothetical protein
VAEGARGPWEALPVDPALPALGAVARHGVDATLRAIGLRPPFGALAVLKHHPASRCTFALNADGRPLVVKAFRRGDIAGQVELMRALERYGLATGTPPTAPRLVTADHDLRILVFEHLAGPRNTALLARGTRAGLLAADWLRRQWAAPIGLGAPYGAAEFLARVERNTIPIAAASPELGTRAAQLVAVLRENPPVTGEPVLVHGSFSPAHIIDLGTGAGVIDWDGAVRGPRELDAAAFPATVARMAAGRPAIAREAAAAGAAFRGAIAADVDPAALAWYETGARIRNARHACVHRTPGWAARAETLLTPAPAPVPSG